MFHIFILGLYCVKQKKVGRVSGYKNSGEESSLKKGHLWIGDGIQKERTGASQKGIRRNSGTLELR